MEGHSPNESTGKKLGDSSKIKKGALSTGFSI